MKHFLVIIVLLLVSGGGALAQAADSLPRQKEIFFGIGPVAYKGDLNASYSKWSSMFQAGLKFNRFSRFNGHLVVSIGSVSGQNIQYTFDDGSDTAPTPNRFFTARLAGFHYELHYNVLHTEKWKIYISQGMGLFRFDPQDEFNKSFVNQLDTRAPNETYGNITLTLPTQVGVLYTLPNAYGVGVQVGYMNTLTDYLDNISDWGTQAGHDNLFSVCFQIHIPLAVQKSSF